jgi:hypothetical protein
VHVRWPGDILVNGAKAGEIATFVSETAVENAEPDWMVVSLDVAITLDLSVPKTPASAWTQPPCTKKAPVRWTARS